MRSLVLLACVGLTVDAVAAKPDGRIVTRVVVRGPHAEGENHWRDPGVLPELKRWEERRFWRKSLDGSPGGSVRWWHGLPVVRGVGVGRAADPGLVAAVAAHLDHHLDELGVPEAAVKGRLEPVGKRRATLVLDVQVDGALVGSEAAVPSVGGDLDGEPASAVHADGVPDAWRRRAERKAVVGRILRMVDRLEERTGVDLAGVTVGPTADRSGFDVDVRVDRAPETGLSPLFEITAPATLWGAAGGLAWSGKGMSGSLPRASIAGMFGYTIYQGWQPKIEFQPGNHGPRGYLAGEVDLARDLALVRAHVSARFDLIADPGFRGVAGSGLVGAAWQPTRRIRSVVGLRARAWQHRGAPGQGDNFATLFTDGPAPALAGGQVLAVRSAWTLGERPRAALGPLTRLEVELDPVGWVVSPAGPQRFHRARGRLQVHRPLGDPRVMGLLWVEGGAVGGPGSTVASLDERLYLGSRSLPGRGWRAMPPAGLGFPDSDEPRIGAEVLLAAQGELRFDVAHGLHGIVHANVGRTWLPEVKAVNLGDLIPAAGVGAGVLTPIGRMDLMAVSWLGPWAGPGPAPPRIALHLFLVP